MDLAEDLFGDDTNVQLPPLPGAAAATEDVTMGDAGENGVNEEGEAEKMAVEEEEEDDGGLFGDGSDDDEEEERAPAGRNDLEDDGPSLSESEAARRHELEYEEQSDPSKLVTKELTLAQIEMANFGIPPASKVWLARLPNFLALNTVPFDELMWEEDGDKAEEEDEESAAKTQILDENVIRWRWTSDENGQPVKESNSRIVRWSDGSLSLQVGSELFDISASVDHSSIPDPSTSTSLPSSKPNPNAIDLASFDPHRSHGLTYVTANHAYATLLESQACVHGTLSFRPSTLQSNTHRKLAGRIKVKNAKERVMKVADLPDEDPEKKKLEREKAELDKAKKLKREQQKGSRAKGGRGKQRRETRFSDGEDHEDEEEGGDSDDEMRGAERSSRKQSQHSRREATRNVAAREEDEDDDGFVVDDDDEGGKDGKDDEESEEEASDSEEEDKNESNGEEKMAPKRRLVVEDDEDE